MVGVMEITLDLVVTKAGPPGQQIDLKAGSKVTMTATVDACVDGSRSESAGKMATKGDLTGTTMGIDVKIHVVSDSDDGTAEVDKK